MTTPMKDIKRHYLAISGINMAHNIGCLQDQTTCVRKLMTADKTTRVSDR